MKKCIALFFLILFTTFTYACSTFLLSKDGHYYFGRNYDWVTGNGMVMINSRGLQKTALKTDDGKQLTWTASCGSITFNQYGKEFPTGGMNEKGLVVELMWLAEAKYPAPDDRPSLNVLQWIQYQLDNHATVTEVLASDKKLRISHSASAPLHYLIADATGDVATVEFLDGQMVVHRGKSLDFPVLTNTVYKEAATQVRKNGVSRTFSDNSVNRFATACRLVQKFQTTSSNQPPVDYAFSVLEQVAQGDFTKWQIVYDISNRQIHFRTHNQRERKRLAFDQFNFSCNQPSLAFNMAQSAPGTVFAYFTPLSFTQNETLINESIKASQSQLTIPSSAITEAIAYFHVPRCTSH